LIEPVSIKLSRTALFQGPLVGNVQITWSVTASVTVKMKASVPLKCQNIQPRYGTGTTKVTAIWTTPAMKRWTVTSLKVLQQPGT